MSRTGIGIVIALLLSGPLLAQEPIPVSSELDQYLRVLELEGKATATPLVFRSSSMRPRARGLLVDSVHWWSAYHPLRPVTVLAGRFHVSPLDWQAEVVFNSAFPRVGNDGALWAGRGISGTLGGGAEVTRGPFTARLAPMIVYAQNRAFDLAPNQVGAKSPYAYPWLAGIDLPQRFGDSSLRRFDWGQSGIRVDWRALTAGITNENLWWGPGFRNALILGSSAPGFPHLDLGTGRPVRTAIGTIEVRGLWGILYRSPYSDGTTADDRRLLTGLTIGYRPSFLPGLTLGLNRVLYQEWPHPLHVGDFTNFLGGVVNNGSTPLSNGRVGNDLADQIASVTMRWLIPQGGFEAYAEWARTDFAGSILDLAVNPDHSRAYTVGFQKTVSARQGPWKLAAEFTTLGAVPSSLLRVPSAPTFYAHNFALEGYTNRGQILGAAIGPGSQSQYLGLDRYHARGRWGVFVERIRYDDDWYLYGDGGQSPYRNQSFTYIREQVDLIAGASVLRFIDRFDVRGTVEFTYELNRYFELWRNVPNLMMGFSTSWRGAEARH